MRIGVVIALVMSAFVFAVGPVVAVGCASIQAAKEGAAESAYTAEHMRCVDEYNTKAEIDACRAAVRIRWGVDARDAGGEQ